MSDQHNPEDQEPIRFTDKRRVDPETGQLRDQEAAETEAGEPTQGSEQADPLSQVEDILNAAGAEADETEEAEAEAPVEDEAAALREDLQRLQAEFVNYRRRVERDRDVAKDNANFAML